MSEKMDPLSYHENLLQARIASRWVADYQRRLLSYLRVFEDGIKQAERTLAFEDWAPLHHWTVPKTGTKLFHQRTMWHFLPLLAVRACWQTARTPIAGGARVVLDIALDSGWKRGGNDEHPDPANMQDAAQCSSPVHVSVYRVIGTCVGTWTSTVSACKHARPNAAGFDEISIGPMRLFHRRLKTDLSMLPDRDALENRLIKPIAEVLRASP